MARFFASSIIKDAKTFNSNNHSLSYYKLMALPCFYWGLENGTDIAVAYIVIRYHGNSFLVVFQIKWKFMPSDIISRLL
jgi:hypothetical protein